MFSLTLIRLVCFGYALSLCIIIFFKKKWINKIYQCAESEVKHIHINCMAPAVMLKEPSKKFLFTGILFTFSSWKIAPRYILPGYCGDHWAIPKVSRANWIVPLCIFKLWSRNLHYLRIWHFRNNSYWSLMWKKKQRKIFFF